MKMLFEISARHAKMFIARLKKLNEKFDAQYWLFEYVVITYYIMFTHNRQRVYPSKNAIIFSYSNSALQILSHYYYYGRLFHIIIIIRVINVKMKKKSRGGTGSNVPTSPKKNHNFGRRVWKPISVRSSDQNSVSGKRWAQGAGRRPTTFFAK